MMPRVQTRTIAMAAAAPNDNHLIWIDLEITGLDPGVDSVIEIATLVTDKYLNILAEGPELAIAHSLERLQAMDDWNRKTHSKSGLWQRGLDRPHHMGTAAALTVGCLQ